MSGDEDSAMSDNEEKCGPSEPVKAPGVFHAPTTQEVVELREGSELFKSNSFKLQNNCFVKFPQVNPSEVPSRGSYYLAVIASSLTGYSLGLTAEDLSYESLEYDIRQTTLVISPTIDSSSELTRSKFPLSIRIIPVLPSNHPLSERHLGPGRACIQTSGSSDLDPTPTPLNNDLALLGTTPVSHLLLIHNAKGQILAFGDTLALLRVWANQRGYGTGAGHRSEDSAQRAGAWWGGVIVYLVLGGKPVKGVKKQARVGRGLSSYQLFRAVLDFLAKHDFATTPMFLGGGPFGLAGWEGHRGAIFVDGSGKYNMLAGVPLESLELLRLDAQASLSLLDEASDEAFEAIFLQDLRNPRLRFDYLLNRTNHSEDLRNPRLRFDYSMSALLSQLTSTVRKALGTRVKACVVLQPTPTLRPPVPINTQRRTTEAPRLVDLDYGPPADDAAGSEVFGAFWGPKSELRRFKDDRIFESVVWAVSHPDERAPFDALVKQIKSAEDLPLSLVTASPISPSLRGTSVFYPWPMDLARYSALPDSIKYIPPMEAILQLEKSARWPDDLAVIQKIKLAFFVGIADALRARDENIRTSVALESDATETDIHDNCSLEVLTPSGFAFRLWIYHDREKALLDGIISDSNAAPGMAAAAKDALRIHETRFLHMPRRHAAVAALSHW
ncbi:hypothetical protein FRC11_000523 [Ceratobasidium sp. 423]|nr:hypothetical protein FRC11_000523 [Ceratobasidium sp. 423]